jgi:hypothetical protein
MKKIIFFALNKIAFWLKVVYSATDGILMTMLVKFDQIIFKKPGLVVEFS